LVADHPEESWKEFISLPSSEGALFIVLDNFSDPVAEAKQATHLLRDQLRGILVDTDSSRRGDIKTIMSEIKWNLRLLGYDDVKLCLTGGVTTEVIEETKAYVASYGVGLSALAASN
jgi:nicotinate phosphoribosyltransferase